MPTYKTNDPVNLKINNQNEKLSSLRIIITKLLSVNKKL